jgi:hypothetical protein
VAVIAGLFLLQARPKPGLRLTGFSTDPVQPFVADPDVPLSSLAMLSFDLEGRRITLQEGRIIERLPGYAQPWETGLTQYQVEGDLNGDGVPDAAAVMVSSNRGVVSKFFLVACLRRKDRSSRTGVSAMATNTVLLGEDIVPDQFTYAGGGLEIRFLSRGPGEAPGTPATWVREFRFTVKDGVLAGVPIGKKAM